MTDTEMTTNTTMMMLDAETAREPSSRNLWVVLVGVAVSTFGILAAVWLVVNPAKDTLWYEVAKASLQVLGVAVIGGIVTFATTKFQQDRQNADQKFQAERQRADF
jgi:hypothetical protein